MQTNLILAVRGVMRDREIKRLLPQASNKTEPVVQRRNPARAARKAARRAQP
jgi:hypothetical protein